MAKIKGFGALGKLFGVEPPPEKNMQPPKKSQSKKSSPQPKKSSSRPPTTPYNFVSLPENVLPAQIRNVDEFKKHVTSAETVSGEILLDIETLTPLFIGNDTKTFAPTGKPIIPGSSLRGMFKNIFKIVTCGAFRANEDFNDEHIYFRCLMAPNDCPAWMTDLHAHYEDLMEDTISNRKKACPGFLIQCDGKYFIAKAVNPETGEFYMNDSKNDYILIRDFQKRFGKVKFRDSRVFWHENIAYCLTGNQYEKRPDKLLDEAEYAEYKKKLKILSERLKSKELTKAQYQQEVQLINHGKQIIRFTRLEYVDWCRENWLEVDDEVLNSYRHDRNRKGVDLFDDRWILNRDRLAEKLQRFGKIVPQGVQSLVPCHFLTDNDKISAFGHGQCFRIPYEKSIGDAVKISGNELIDFADAVFGRKEFWASRVYFEDAAPVDETISELPTCEAHPLMQPNPTSYQLYLKQDAEKLKHWDTVGAQIRGYKLYWHKPADWQANSFELAENRKRLADGKEPLTPKMTPLDTGSKFTAKIRFKNLSRIELGALMMIFDLDGATNSAYKIGHGKPFGFGSVRITPKLFVEHEAAYGKLFDADGWQNPYREKNPAEYLDAFRQHLKNCGIRSMFDTWRQVMDELKIILDWSPTKRAGWSDAVKQMFGEPKKNPDGKETMELDERFKQREKLPTIRTIFEAVK